MKVSGIDVSSGASVEVSFERAITIVDHLIRPLDDAPFLAPGWIDLQVNGFAGVDYNSPSSSHEQIAQSIRAMFACGVTRFFPTVITGSPENMTAALRNLASAKESIRGGRRPWRRSIWKAPTFRQTTDRAARIRRAGSVRPISTSSHRFQEAAGGNIRLVTLSPEWPEAPHFIEKIVEKGVVASIGHTRASAAADCGRGQRRRNAIHASWATAPMPCCPAIPIICGSNWPRIVWRPASSSTDFICRRRS